jgi:hypothetical protein
MRKRTDDPTTRVPGFRRRPGARAAVRRGISIIETIVLMTGLAAILGLCTLMLQLLMKLDGQTRSRLEGANSFARLSAQFRQDVHDASAVRLMNKPQAKPVVLRVDLAKDRSIEYQVKREGTVLRIETQKGKPLRRESYEIPRCEAVRLAVEQEQGRELATIDVDLRASPLPTDPPRVLQIVALVGKNRDRLAVSATAGGGKP